MSEETAVINVEYSVTEIEPSHVQAMMTRIAEMRSIVHKNLVKDHDYGIIPGCKKPSLLKPGAEKILMLFGLTSEYDVIEKVYDYDKGFFAFTVKCILKKNGQLVTEGLGEANIREAKWRYRWVPKYQLPKDADISQYPSKQSYNKTVYRIENDDPFTLVNTVLKISKKRAFVDAILTVGSLSDIFTQDIEDFEDASFEESDTSKPEPQPKPEPRKPEPPKPTLMDEFNALKQRYVTVTGNVPHAENAMKKVAVEGGHAKVTREYLDALVEDILVREHDKGE